MKFYILINYHSSLSRDGNYLNAFGMARFSEEINYKLNE